MYSLIPHLDALYRERTTSNLPVTRNDFSAWAKKTRKKLRTLLGIKPQSFVRAGESIIEPYETFDLETVDLTLEDEVIIPVYIAKPKGVNAPLKTIILYHGHADGARTIFGQKLTKEYQDYGLAFLRAGYAVAVIDQRGFAERLGPAPITYNGYTRSCRQLSFDLMLYGKTLLGERVVDGLVLVDYLKTRTDLDTRQLVVSGNSGGGTTSLFHAALDERLAGAMVSGAYAEYKQSIMELSHCECNYVPGLFRCINEIHEVGALIAPRPLLVIHGQEDTIFPVAAAQAAVTKTQPFFELARSSQALEMQLHGGGHRYDHGRVFNFLTEQVFREKQYE